MALTQALGRIVHDNAALFEADTLRVCDGADLIVTGSPSEHRAACVAESRGIPLVCLRYAPMRPIDAYPEHADHHKTVAAPPEPWRRIRCSNGCTGAALPRTSTSSGEPQASAGQHPDGDPPGGRGTLELQAYHPALVPDLTDYPARWPIIGF
jgi:hypothetical protein